MQSFKSKLRAIPHTLNEGRLSDITIKLKRVWTKLKRAITSLFQRALKKAEIGEEVSLSIPGQQNESKFENGEMIMEGPLQVIKGNYNEALVLQYIYNWDKDGVDIVPKWDGEFRKEIEDNVDKWEGDLKDLAKSNKKVDYRKELKIIEQGSEDMTRYLVHTAVEEGATIIGGELDNLSYLEGGIASKADIKLHVLKDGKEDFEKHSLKIYSTKSVGLANTTAAGLAKHLVGEKAEQKVIDAIKKDKKLSEMIEKAGLVDSVKQDHKIWLKDPKGKQSETKKNGLRAFNRLMSLRAPRIDGSEASKTKQIHDLDQDKLEAERKVLREPINKKVAYIVYNIIKPYSNTEEFGENILKMLGLKDKETKMLMSVSTAKKSLILDKHPELNMADVSLVWNKGVSISVMGPTGKTIVSFGVKEGEKKAVAGKVSFADVTPVDLANYPLFDA